MAKKLNRGPKALGKIVIPKWALDDELLFEVDDRIGGILFAYRATHEKMDELSRDEMWLDLKLSRRDNKDRMKELGGAHASRTAQALLRPRQNQEWRCECRLRVFVFSA
jgi:hypothetical protein